MFVKSNKKETEMKKRICILGIALAAIVMFGLSGCQQNTSDDSKNTLYYVEGGILSKTTLQTIVAPYENKTDFTYNEIKAIRNQLRACELEDFFSEKDVTRDDCHNFLTQHGFTPSEANQGIESVNNTGNALLFFNVRNSPSKAIYIYAEKQ